MTGRKGVRLAGGVACCLALVSQADAHSGPPYPIVSNRTIGAYSISIWTDPDATDDRSAAGRFWVTLDPSQAGVVVPAETRARVSVAPSDRPGAEVSEEASPVDGRAARQFAALVMDHEGAYRVRVTISGPLGTADVEAEVQATYDLRPAPALLALYVLPFALAGFLWTKRLLRRRRAGGARLP